MKNLDNNWCSYEDPYDDITNSEMEVYIASIVIFLFICVLIAIVTLPVWLIPYVVYKIYKFCKKEKPMRDPNRIYEFCNELAEIWSKVPDWRFGQLVINVLGPDPFYMEDDRAMKCFRIFLDEVYKKKENENEQ